MKKIIKMVGDILIVCCLLYFWAIYLTGYLINHWYTNSASESVTKIVPVDIPTGNSQVNTYLSHHPEDTQAVKEAYTYLNGTWINTTGWFPPDVAEDSGFRFIMEGIDKRKEIITTIKTQSATLWIDYRIVLASLLGEQIRIATKWIRDTLKDIVIHSTPTLFCSYNISLGVWGIKLTTARQIVTDAKKYWYGDIFWKLNYNDSGLTAILTTSDYWQGVYPTYLIKNIITRRQLSGYDISHNVGVIATLYNMWNAKKKQPNANPQIGGSEITIGQHKYVYGGIALWVYRYLKIYGK